MKIIVDKDIPFIKGVFEPYAEVVYLSGKDIDRSAVAGADALVIRTRTKCNSALLEGSSVKFIATATIGMDHIDLEYCKDSGVEVANAAGCNSGGVMQYVYTSLYALSTKKSYFLPDGISTLAPDGKKLVLGVIGVGNVGSKVANMGEYMGFEVLRCDPVKEREQTLAFNNGYMQLKDFKDYYSLDYLLENADIVTLHVNLHDGSRGLADEIFFKRMKDGAVFINSSRGEVVDEGALLENKDKLSGIIIDVWNGEPQINPELLAIADIATPHIAGYSYEGKVNGTTMAVKAVAAHFGIEMLKDFSIVPAEKNNNLFSKAGKSKEEISEYLSNIFPIFGHCADLKENPQDFELLRSNFKYRREFYVI